MSNQKTYVLYAMGSGETSHAFAVAKKLIEKKQRVILILKQKVNSIFFIEHPPEFPVISLPRPRFIELKKVIDIYKPDILVLFNSKSFYEDRDIANLKKSPFPHITTISVDSNWYFNSKSKNDLFIYAKWMDKYIVNIPERIFNLGKKENGRYFTLDRNISNRLVHIGFIPSYDKLPIETKERVRKQFSLTNDEKLIFCYYSGVGANARPWILDKMIKVVKRLRSQGLKIKILAIGDKTSLETNEYHELDWVIFPQHLSLKLFYEYLASADLVFQHQGLATLAQAISGQVPTIANVSILRGDEYPYKHPGAIMPFHRLNLCEMLFKSTSLVKTIKTVKMLLYDKEKIQKMRRNQLKYYEKGEDQLYLMLQSAS